MKKKAKFTMLNSLKNHVLRPFSTSIFSSSNSSLKKYDITKLENNESNSQIKETPEEFYNIVTNSKDFKNVEDKYTLCKLKTF